VRRRSDRPDVRARLRAWGGAWLLLVLAASAVGAAEPSEGSAQLPPSLAEKQRENVEETTLREAAIALPVAAVLGAVLAFRPRRRGMPPRVPAVAQSQILLTLVGALVMLVVGASLARAFAIVGAASLVRYRSKVGDPKEAGVMLCCLAIGMAAGVGIHLVAAAATLFILAVVWVLEALEPVRRKELLLKIKGKELAGRQKGIEQVLHRNGARHDLRTTAQDDLTYSVELPLMKKTERLTAAILALAPKDEMAVEWQEKKSKDA
jgi:hypothetical protein